MRICPTRLICVISISLILFVTLSSISAVSNLRSFVVLTGSMNPAIPQGSMMYVSSQPEYKKGDIITFSTPNGSRITHRIAEVAGQAYVTRGDANSVSDQELVLKEQIIGKTFFTIPHMGNIVLFLKSIYGIVSVLLFAVIIVAIEIAKSRKKLNENYLDMFAKTELNK